MTSLTDAFRSAMRRVPTGVTVVTTIRDGRPKGFTANAFASVSANPAMVLICVNREARSYPLIAAAGHFCVNVLRLDQIAIAERFASHAEGDPFESIAYRFDRSGSPVFDDALAYLDCELASDYAVGTHTIFIGKVLACVARDGSPLGYFNGAYRDFGCAIP
ncbi:MAG: hypothetical protein NVS4B5_07090 [Vulcanimicrobiaceae bacterium]